MICIFYCLIWFLVRFMWLTVGYHVLCHIFGLDSFIVKNISVKKCFDGHEACFGLSAIHWWLGGGRILRLVPWSGSEFSGKKNFVPELCGKLANWDLMHYRWVLPNTSSLASPVDEHGWLVVTSDIMEPSSQWTRFVFAC